mgnify:CR=1 FL=1
MNFLKKIFGMGDKKVETKEKKMPTIKKSSKKAGKKAVKKTAKKSTKKTPKKLTKKKK